MQHFPFVVWFADIDIHETSRIGKTGKHFGKLTQAGFPIPPGFVITQDAYKTFLKQQFLDEKIKNLLLTVNHRYPESIQQGMHHIQQHIKQVSLPQQLTEELEILYNYIAKHHLHLQAHTTTSPAYKIAQQEATTFEEILAAIKELWIQQFTSNVYWKRREHNLDHTNSSLEIIAQVVIDPDRQGKIYTIDPHEHTKNIMNITQDHLHSSDKYVLSKKTSVIIDRHLTYQSKETKLTHEQLLTLARLGKSVEQYLYFPQEITWGMIDDAFYIIDTKQISSIPKAKPDHKQKLAHAKGTAVTTTIGTGVVRVILEEKDFDTITSYDVVIIKKLDTKHMDKLRKVRAIVTETGERHSEIVTHIRQLGIPTLFHIKDATKRYKNGRVITVHAKKGHIYLGSLH